MKKRSRMTLNKTQRPYRPPKWAAAYVSACLDMTITPTKTARCEAINIDRGTLWLAEAKPEFVEWVNERLQRALQSSAHDVRMALVRMCMKENLEAICKYHVKSGYRLLSSS